MADRRKPSKFTGHELHPQIAALRRRGYGRIVARCAAALVAIEDLGAAVTDIDVRTPDGERDGFPERRATAACDDLRRHVGDMLVRAVEFEARRTIDRAVNRGEVPRA